MAFLFPSAILFLLLSSSTASAANSPTRTREFDDMLQSLRSYGYALFTNGIATSDLKYELLSAAADFTLFAPRDELLYALDMAADAAFYVSTLRYHVISSRHTFAGLKNLSAPFLDTLLPDYAVLIGKVRDVDADSDRASVGLIVNGVRIAYPDLFLGSRIAVHGIEGILLTGLNMSRDLEYGSGHFPPIGSPAPALHPIPTPPSNESNIPAEMPNSPTPAPAPMIGNIPAKVIRKADTPSPPASTFIGIIPAKGIQKADAPAPGVTGNIPAPEIGRNDVPPAASREWAATPTISQEQIEKMKRLRMKTPGKRGRKGRRRHRRRKELRDL
ncbi:fasciclin-like arabinogalactan protein 19 [Salvia splendens]|uniref:fasciclin-like arabinogalactan protein 19 n=1 Tax=Salvia splendens TaxID=180675 RepID=UPI001C251EDE|nr:fasciclin-like arabinogalactan protein 19 [Salvia splendens]